MKEDVEMMCYSYLSFDQVAMPSSLNFDISPEIIETVLSGLDGVESDLDDVFIFSDSWEEHRELVDKVLSRLQDAGLTINPSIFFPIPTCLSTLKRMQVIISWER
jgi:hypothetical protein